MNRYKQREDSSPLPGAAYIRFSSEMQSDSFSLDAQLRQIKEQAERDGVEIVHELQELDIIFKAVQQPFDLRTPEGKLLFHLISSLGEFYSDNVSKETNKGKLERSLQGYHNGAVPWGYTSQLIGIRKMGVPDPEKAPVVVEMFERYTTGAYSDQEIAEWLNGQGFRTNRHHPFGKDAVRD